MSFVLIICDYVGARLNGIAMDKWRFARCKARSERRFHRRRVIFTPLITDYHAIRVKLGANGTLVLSAFNYCRAIIAISVSRALITAHRGGFYFSVARETRIVAREIEVGNYCNRRAGIATRGKTT